MIPDGYLPCHKKTIKKQTGSVWNFPQPLILLCNKYHNSLFKKQTQLILVPLLFESISQLIGQDLKKWQKNIVSITTLVLQDYPQRYILLYFLLYRPSRALSLSRNFIECSLKALCSTMVGENFQVHSFEIDFCVETDFSFETDLWHFMWNKTTWILQKSVIYTGFSWNWWIAKPGWTQSQPLNIPQICLLGSGV